MQQFAIEKRYEAKTATLQRYAPAAWKPRSNRRSTLSFSGPWYHDRHDQSYVSKYCQHQSRLKFESVYTLMAFFITWHHCCLCWHDPTRHRVGLPMHELAMAMGYKAMTVTLRVMCSCHLKTQYRQIEYSTCQILSEPDANNQSCGAVTLYKLYSSCLPSICVCTSQDKSVLNPRYVPIYDNGSETRYSHYTDKTGES